MKYIKFKNIMIGFFTVCLCTKIEAAPSTVFADIDDYFAVSINDIQVQRDWTSTLSDSENTLRLKHKISQQMRLSPDGPSAISKILSILFAPAEKGLSNMFDTAWIPSRENVAAAKLLAFLFRDRPELILITLQEVATAYPKNFSSYPSIGVIFFKNFLNSENTPRPAKIEMVNAIVNFTERTDIHEDDFYYRNFISRMITDVVGIHEYDLEHSRTEKLVILLHRYLSNHLRQGSNCGALLI
jgi:hypothetical protein